MINYHNKSDVKNVVCQYQLSDTQENITQYDVRELQIIDNVKTFRSYPYYKITINKYGISTFCFENPFKLPEGLTGCTCTRNNDNKTTTFHEIDSKIIPANTGIVLKGAQGEYLIEILNSDTQCPLVGDNDLVGTIESTEIPEGSYILVAKNNDIGWFIINTNDRTLAKYKAYIPPISYN